MIQVVVFFYLYKKYKVWNVLMIFEVTIRNRVNYAFRLVMTWLLASYLNLSGKICRILQMF